MLAKADCRRYARDMSICYVDSPVGRLALESDHDAVSGVRWASRGERAGEGKPGEWKDYAFGRDGQTWERDANPQWRAIQGKGINNYQHSLATQFCTFGLFSGGPLGSAKALVRNLKYPPPAATRVPPRYN